MFVSGKQQTKTARRMFKNREVICRHDLYSLGRTIESWMNWADEGSDLSRLELKSPKPIVLLRHSISRKTLLDVFVGQFERLWLTMDIYRC